jgi:hypothetical protein
MGFDNNTTQTGEKGKRRGDKWMFKDDWTIEHEHN